MKQYSVRKTVQYYEYYIVAANSPKEAIEIVQNNNLIPDEETLTSFPDYEAEEAAVVEDEE